MIIFLLKSVFNYIYVFDVYFKGSVIMIIIFRFNISCALKYYADAWYTLVNSAYNLSRHC